MKLKSIPLFLLLPALMLLLAACGGTQAADTPTPEAKVVAKVEIEMAPTTIPHPSPIKPSASSRPP